MMIHTYDRGQTVGSPDISRQVGGYATQHNIVWSVRRTYHETTSRFPTPATATPSLHRCGVRAGVDHVWTGAGQTARDDWTAGTSMSRARAEDLGAGAGAIAPVCACMHARGLAAHSAAASQSGGAVARACLLLPSTALQRGA